MGDNKPEQPAPPTNEPAPEAKPIAVSKYNKGQVLQYKDSNDSISAAEILKVHFDDELEPFYTIKLPCGKEKQTDDAHLSMPEVFPIHKEIERMLYGFSSEHLQQIHDFMKNLQGSGMAVSSNDPSAHGSGTPVRAPTPNSTGGISQTGSQAPSISIPSPSPVQAAGGIPSPSPVKVPPNSMQAVPAPPLYQQQPPAPQMQHQPPQMQQPKQPAQPPPQPYAQQQQAQMPQQQQQQQTQQQYMNQAPQMQQPPQQMNHSNHQAPQQMQQQGQMGGQAQQMTQQPQMQQVQAQQMQPPPQQQATPISPKGNPFDMF
jgi:hypothetical protein